MSIPQPPDPKSVRVYDRPESADASPLSRLIIPIVVVAGIVILLALAHFAWHKF